MGGGGLLTFESDPNTLYLDPDPKICSNLDLHPIYFTRSHYHFDGEEREKYLKKFVLRKKIRQKKLLSKKKFQLARETNYLFFC